MAGLQLNDVVRVDVTLTPRAIPTRNFGVPLIIGSSDTIDVYERRRLYASLDQVTEDFETTDPEYMMADAFFSQNPQPSLCYIGRWAQSATNAILYGGVLSPAEQLVSNWVEGDGGDPITDGAMFLWIDGVPTTVSGLNFTGQTNINGIAGVMQTALAAILASTKCEWMAAQGRFRITSGTSGATSKFSWAEKPTAWSSVTYTKQPANNDVLTIGGQAVTWKDTVSDPTTQVAISAVDLAHSLSNWAAMVNESAISALMDVRVIADGTHLYIYAAESGTAGNDITIVKTTDTGSAATLGNAAGGKLNGGLGTDVSDLFKLSSAKSAPAPVDGMASETPLACVTLHADESHAWYAVMFACDPMPTLNQQEAVAQFIEGAGPSRTYWFTSGDSTCLDGQTTADPAGAMHTLNLARTIGQYSTTNPYAIASLFGRFANVDFRQNNSCITAKFKQEPGIVAETLTETQNLALMNKKMNVFVNYDEDFAIVQEGTCMNGDFIDERIGCDWLQNALQIGLFNVLYTAPNKVPQTDAGTALLLAACKQVCEAAVFNGFVAPGQWNGPPFGKLKNGDVLTTGYYIFAPPVNSQSQADREARKSVPIQIGIKLAGAVHSVICSVWVNR